MTQEPPIGCIWARNTGFTLGTTAEAMIPRTNMA